MNAQATAAPVAVALAFDDSTVFVEPDQFDGTVSTGAHECSGVDRTLVVITSALKKFAPNVQVSSLTFDGVAMTFRTRGVRTYTGDDNIVIEIWTMDNPPTGSQAVQVTWSHSVKSVHTTCLSYVGANNGVGAVANAGSAPTANPTVDITTLSGTSFTIGGCAVQGGDTDPFTPGAGQEERSDGATGLNNGRDQGYCTSDEPSTGGLETHQYTASGSDDWAIAVIELNAA